MVRASSIRASASSNRHASSAARTTSGAAQPSDAASSDAYAARAWSRSRSWPCAEAGTTQVRSRSAASGAPPWAWTRSRKRRQSFGWVLVSGVPVPGYAISWWSAARNTLRIPASPTSATILRITVHDAS